VEKDRDKEEREPQEEREPPQERDIASTRFRRSAKLGTAIGGQATRYAGTVAANVARSD
jgi:hypothetical protein